MSTSKGLSASVVALHSLCGHPSSGRATWFCAVLRVGCLIALTVWLCVGIAAAECIDYGDYLHWAGSVDTPNFAYGVAVSGTHAYVADYLSGLQVIDIANPASLQIVGSVDTPGAAWGVAVSGTHAYVADYGSGLQVIDITNPASPAIVNGVDTPNFAYGVAVSGTHAYVANSSSGLQVAPTQCEPSSGVEEDDHANVSVPVVAGPNPGSSQTSIRFALRSPGQVQLALYDVAGRLVRELFGGPLPAGDHSLTWDGRTADGHAAAPGVYFAHLSTPEGKGTARVVVAP